MESAVVGQGVAKVEIQVDHLRLGGPREPCKLTDQLSRRIVRKGLGTGWRRGVVRSIPSRDRGVVDIDKDDRMRAGEQTDVRRMDHVVEMIFFDDHGANGSEIERS